MKYWVLVCEGMADDPIEQLNGRTPLEAAKTPFMDQLAKNGKIGNASFIPSTLPASSDVACMSLLGYDPKEFYTGLAPLEALALEGIQQNDRQIAFRCDFVTAFDDVLVDPTAGMISDRESAILMKGLSEKVAGNRFKFYPAGGYKNILISEDAEMADDLDDMECVSPQNCLGKPIQKNFPKGKGEAALRDLIQTSRSILENHDVNRVRIDLKENPANLVWLWGQGKRPKLPSFKQRQGLDGSVFSKEDFMKGLAKGTGLEVSRTMNFDSFHGELLFVYFAAPENLKNEKSLKAKVRFIEDFDANVVGKAVKAAERSQEVRICVTSDTVESTDKKTKLSGQVPLLIQGKDIAAGNTASFNEKACSQSGWTVEEGHRWLESFIKK